jgi:hypothetical protein
MSSPIKSHHQLRGITNPVPSYTSPFKDSTAVQPAVLGETFPPCSKDKELNIAEVLVTCNFIFRDA